MNKIKIILKVLLFLGVGYYFAIILFGAAVNSGFTNSESREVASVDIGKKDTVEIDLMKEMKTRLSGPVHGSGSTLIPLGTGSINVVQSGATENVESGDVSVEVGHDIAPEDIINAKRRYVSYRLSSVGLLDALMMDYIEKHPDDIGQVLESYDSFNSTNAYPSYLNYEKEFLANLKKLSNEELYAYAVAINRNYVEEKLRNQKKFGFINQELLKNPQFNFVFEGIKNHKGVKESLDTLTSNLKMDKEYVLSCIMTEQTRYSITQRGNVKRNLKNVPFLFSYTYGSKGIGGIKDFTADKIAQDAKTYGYGEVFAKGGGDLNDPYWEVAYPTYLIKNILTRWEKAGYPISSQPGIVATLYNFGNPDNKNPNAEPKIGGSVIQIASNNSLTFGELGRNFYYYFKIYGFGDI